MKREADSYADEKKSNADAQAESILREAKEKAFKMVNEANNKYREVLAVGEEKIREQLAQYTYLAKQMDDFKSNLKSICESQIELIDSQKVDDSKIKEYIKEYPLKTEQ